MQGLCIFACALTVKPQSLQDSVFTVSLPASKLTVRELWTGSVYINPVLELMHRMDKASAFFFASTNCVGNRRRFEGNTVATALTVLPLLAIPFHTAAAGLYEHVIYTLTLGKRPAVASPTSPKASSGQSTTAASSVVCQKCGREFRDFRYLSQHKQHCKPVDRPVCSTSCDIERGEASAERPRDNSSALDFQMQATHREAVGNLLYKRMVSATILGDVKGYASSMMQQVR